MLYLKEKMKTFAAKLGFPKDARVVIFQIDDVGMSWESTQGAFDVLQSGLPVSMSSMMPCGWVPLLARLVVEHPKAEIGVHLTLTSEGAKYRWGPLLGKKCVPGLVDQQHAFWPTVEQVVSNASAEEVEAELIAQIERAASMGLEVRFLTPHQGVTFQTEAFRALYIRIAVKTGIPILWPGGHMSMIGQTISDELKAEAQKLGEYIWQQGLPVFDDLHDASFRWSYPAHLLKDDEVREFATEKYCSSIRALQPGLTLILTHCARSSESFPAISRSSHICRGDYLALSNPAFHSFLREEGILVTSWREIAERRSLVTLSEA